VAQEEEVAQEDEAGEADEEEDEEGVAEGATAFSSSSGVYLRGPSTLPNKPQRALRPVIRPVGQRQVTLHVITITSYATFEIERH
jgi:hypothetical protein